MYGTSTFSYANLFREKVDVNIDFVKNINYQRHDQPYFVPQCVYNVHQGFRKNVVCNTFVSCVHLFIIFKSNCSLTDDRILINLIVIEAIMCKWAFYQEIVI